MADELDIVNTPFVNKMVLKRLFDMENRIRVLEGKQPITLDQVKQALRDLQDDA